MSLLSDWDTCDAARARSRDLFCAQYRGRRGPDILSSSWRDHDIATSLFLDPKARQRRTRCMRAHSPGISHLRATGIALRRNTFASDQRKSEACKYARPASDGSLALFGSPAPTSPEDTAIHQKTRKDDREKRALIDNDENSRM